MASTVAQDRHGSTQAAGQRTGAHWSPRRCSATAGVTGVQALNGFTDVARRRLGMTWAEVSAALGAIRMLCRAIPPIDIETHADAPRIAERHGYAIFDALKVAAALRAGCAVLYSQHMDDGMAIGGSRAPSIRSATHSGGGVLKPRGGT